MLLLDTHILLWWINGAQDKLPEHVLEKIEEAETLAVSAISCFEIEWLACHGRIQLEINLEEWFATVFAETELICVPVTCDVARLAASLPEHHKDPQDRLIIATALLHGAHIISADRQFSLYEEISHLLIQP